MCDPATAAVIGAVGTVASLGGSLMQASAASANQKAIADANTAQMMAQNQAFNERIRAASQQTQQQLEASQETLAARNAAANQVRDAQVRAIGNYQDTLATENAQANALRQRGDIASQQLLDATNAQALQQQEQQRQQATMAAVNQNAVPGPTTSDPSGSTDAVRNDLTQGGALARRTAEAATNIRNYGSRIAAVDAAQGPLQQIGLATADTKYGIMPAQQAEALLRSGSDTRLLPSKVGYGMATALGGAQDTRLQLEGQSALDAAALSYGNAVDLANLKQSDADTIAGNVSKQKQADAQALAAQGGVLAGIGKLGLYGAGYYGGNQFGAAPGWAAGTGAGSGIYTNLATGATTDQPGVTMPNMTGFLSKIF